MMSTEKRNGYFAACLALVLLTAFTVSCGQNEKPAETSSSEQVIVSIPVENILVEDLSIDQEKGLKILNLGEKEITDWLTDTDTAAAAFEQYGFPKEAAAAYTAEWFRDSCLAMVILSSNPSYEFNVLSAENRDKELCLTVREDIPQACFDIACFKGILIELPKEAANPDIRITVERDIQYSFNPR